MEIPHGGDMDVPGDPGTLETDRGGLVGKESGVLKVGGRERLEGLT